MLRLVDVEFVGPIWAGGAARVVDWTEDLVREGTEEGDRRVSAVLRPGRGVQTGRFRSQIQGKMLDRRNGGLTDRDPAVGSWLEGNSRRNRRTRFKGYRMYRKTRGALQRWLTRRARERLPELVQKLGG